MRSLRSAARLWLALALAAVFALLWACDTGVGSFNGGSKHGASASNIRISMDAGVRGRSKLIYIGLRARNVPRRGPKPTVTVYDAQGSVVKRRTAPFSAFGFS